MTSIHDESDVEIAQRLKAQCLRERRITPAINWLNECHRDGIWPSPEALEIIASIPVNGGKQSTKGDPSRGEDKFTLRNCIGANMLERHDDIIAELRKKNPKLSIHQAKDQALEQVRAEFKTEPKAPQTTSALIKIFSHSDEKVNAVRKHREDQRRLKRQSRRHPLNPQAFTGP